MEARGLHVVGVGMRMGVRCTMGMICTGIAGVPKIMSHVLFFGIITFPSLHQVI